MTILDSSWDLSKRCPCSSGDVYGECCEPAHSGQVPSPTAERLMRSRFSAYALGLPAYVLSSWHSSTRPTELELDDAQKWYRLDILSRSAGAAFDSHGTVEFVAYYRLGAERGSQHEVSRFVRENKRWFYVDGSNPRGGS